MLLKLVFSLCLVISCIQSKEEKAVKTIQREIADDYPSWRFKVVAVGIEDAYSPIDGDKSFRNDMHSLLEKCKQFPRQQKYIEDNYKEIKEWPEEKKNSPIYSIRKQYGEYESALLRQENELDEIIRLLEKRDSYLDRPQFNNGYKVWYTMYDDEEEYSIQKIFLLSLKLDEVLDTWYARDEDEIRRALRIELPKNCKKLRQALLREEIIDY